ncbi:MAG TPA: four helix bundle protein [Planctomycetota bacterium]|nr:four helix bundle protein [Planctomycetota bacterium]
MAASSFTDLEVWQRAHALRLDVYRLTAGFPRVEIYRLSNQMIRAASSIPASIAEGFRRFHPKDKAHFYRVSDGSSAELLDAFYVCRDLKYLPDITPFMQRIDVIQRMLRRLIQATLGLRPPSA